MRVQKIIFFILFIHTNVLAQTLIEESISTELMGSKFTFTVVTTSITQAKFAIDKGINEVKRIENLISSWKPTSQTSEINKMAGIKPVKVDKELYDLIYRANKISVLTTGAFDITFASAYTIWQFNRQEQTLLSNNIVQKSVEKVNWKHILLNETDTTVFLKEAGMKIGFGGIGKGYAADRAKQVMQDIDGIMGGIINAGGDLMVWGINESHENWQIQIANPDNQDEYMAWLSLKDNAIVTSGDYEKYFTSNSKRYAHIIDPKTGYPVHGVKSVSVISNSTEAADALATALFVLGVENGLNLINQLKNAECIFITNENKIHTSNNLKLNYY